MTRSSRFSPSLPASPSPLPIRASPARSPTSGPARIPPSSASARSAARSIATSANPPIEPIVIVFARTLSDPLGKLVKQLDGAVKEHKAAELRAWVTFLADDQTKLDPLVVQVGPEARHQQLPCGVFEDTVGPPTYLMAKDADVTVLLSVKRKVVANFAFRAGELNDAAIADIVKTIPKIVT